MQTLNTTLVAVALATDALTVSLSLGASALKNTKKNALMVALYFGLFQFIMPLAGWFGGTYFKNLISSFDHWIAFALLVIIGGKMILESLEEKEGDKNFILTHAALFILALATSIDALGVGLSYAFLDVPIVSSAIYIGVVTFCLSFLSYSLGKSLKFLIKNKAELFGGIILLAIGIKILFDHQVFN